MERNILWAPWDTPGLEHLHLLLDDGVLADSVVIGTAMGRPFRIRYVNIPQRLKPRGLYPLFRCRGSGATQLAG